MATHVNSPLLVVAGVIGVVMLAVILIVVASRQDKDAQDAYESQTVLFQVTNLDDQAVPNALVTMGGVQGRTNQQGQWAFQAPVKSSYQMTVTAENPFGNEPQYLRPVRQKVVVTTPPTGMHTAQIVTAKMEGWSVLAQWYRLGDAVRALKEKKQDQVLKLSYSFMKAGHVVNGDGEQTFTIQEYADGTVNETDFKNEIRAAFVNWKSFLETSFSTSKGFPANLHVTLEEKDEGDQGVDLHASHDPTTSPYLGDIRVGIFDHGNPSTLAYAYRPPVSDDELSSFAYSQDILFNTQIDWRKDVDVQDGNGGDGGHSVHYVAAHEIGHSLGLGHDAHHGALMYPMSGLTFSMHSRFPNGFDNSAYEQTAVYGIYA